MNWNNGVLRGTLYTVLPILTTVGAACSDWSKEPPKNIFVVGVVICAALTNAGVSLRGFLDQHLSRNPPSEKIETTSTTSPNP